MPNTKQISTNSNAHSTTLRQLLHKLASSILTHFPTHTKVRKRNPEAHATGKHKYTWKKRTHTKEKKRKQDAEVSVTVT